MVDLIGDKLWVGGIGIEKRSAASLPNLLGIYEKTRKYSFELDPNACKLFMRNSQGADTVVVDGNSGEVKLQNLLSSRLWVGGIGMEKRSPASLPNLLGICEKTRKYTFELDPNACKLFMRNSQGADTVVVDGNSGEVNLQNLLSSRLWVGGIGMEKRSPASLPNLLGICEKTRKYTFELDPNACKLFMRNSQGADTVVVDGNSGEVNLQNLLSSRLWVGGIGIEKRSPASLPNLLGICEKTRKYTFELDPNACKLFMRNSQGADTVVIDGNSGDVILQNADCAEDFEVSEAEPVDAGTVMALNDIGQLEQGKLPYDKRVAGVVSGAGDLKPGLVLGRQPGHSDRVPLALIGRVHCKVDAGYESIEVGDLLTTSATPGHAMKASDPARSFGAVIGKALRPLKTGHGLIPILVALQ